MLKWLMALGTCGLLAFTPAQAAGTFTPSVLSAHSVLDLDTADGSSSMWSSGGIGGFDALRTTLQIHRFGKDPKWLTTTLISLKHGSDWVGFRVARHVPDGPLLMTIERYVGGTDTVVQTFAATLALDQKLDVALDWTADGTLTVRAGDETAQAVSLGTPFDTLQVSNSTCEAEFNPLQIGNL